MNPCDFSNMQNAYTGGEYDILFVGADGYMMFWESGTSAYGFTARVNAVSKGLPPKDNVSQQYRLDVYFTNGGQFKAHEAFPKIKINGFSVSNCHKS